MEGLLWARATQGYSGTTLASVLWKGYFGLLWATQGYSETTLASVLWKNYFGLLRATLGYSGLLWPVCRGRATLSYSGLLRDHFGQCAVEGLLWATQGYSLRDHFGQCAVEGLLWARATQGYSGTATGRTEVQSSKNLTTPQSYGWGTTKGPTWSSNFVCWKHLFQLFCPSYFLGRLETLLWRKAVLFEHQDSQGDAFWWVIRFNAHRGGT